MKNKIFTTLFIIALFFLLITLAIGVPIYCRFFYFMQIDSLNIVSSSGFDLGTIKDAYNSVLDYLTLPWAEFSTGALRYSAEGKAHFEDCKKPFNLNAIVLAISFIIVLVSLILSCKKKIELKNVLGFKPAFCSAVLALIVPLVLGTVVSIDFDKAFTVFHKIFFSGKDNWMFDVNTDEIIAILPQEFFLSCAIIIAVTLVISSTSIIIYCIFKRRQKKS